VTPLEEITQNITSKYIKGLIENGATVELISKSFRLPVKKVERIIQKIKSASN
jgi:hypothetical protein